MLLFSRWISHVTQQKVHWLCVSESQRVSVEKAKLIGQQRQSYFQRSLLFTTALQTKGLITSACNMCHICFPSRGRFQTFSAISRCKNNNMSSLLQANLNKVILEHGSSQKDRVGSPGCIWSSNNVATISWASDLQHMIALAHHRFRVKQTVFEGICFWLVPSKTASRWCFASSSLFFMCYWLNSWSEPAN